jgi:glycosyltransferase involved in cell wall biosynthesis
MPTDGEVVGDIEISVVIPVYNGATTVPGVVDSVRAALAQHSFEVVLVDDGSSDDSWVTIRELAARDEVRGLRMLKNYGQHAAVVAGLEAARGAWVVTIDDDGENDPADIPAMLSAALDGGHDLVFAERLGRRAPLGRRVASRIVNGVVINVFSAPTNLRISNYRLMSAAVAARIVADQTQYPYVNGLALEYSGSPTSVPVEHGDHQGTGSRYTVRTLFRLLSNILFSYSIWAYRLVVGVALVAIALSGIASVLVLVRAAFSDGSAPGWASTVLLFSMMSIVNLVALTVIGEYVVRALRQSRNPARYVVTESA